MNDPLVSIVIAARDAEKTIEKCIASILEVDYPHCEVIVVNDGSNDRTSEILERYREKIEIISHILSVGPAEARNIAAQYAKGDYLAFTDADCIIDKDWLKELLKGFQKFPEAVSCGGRQDIPEGADIFEKRVFLFMKKTGFITDYARQGEGRIIEVPHNASCCSLYRKDIFLKAGGFLKHLWPGEDVELDYRLRKMGYKLVFCPKAIVYHHRPDNLKKFYMMMYRYGYAQGFLVRKYGIFRKIQLIPLATFIFAFFLAVGLYVNWAVALSAAFLLSLALLAYFSGKLSFGLPGIIIWHLGYIRGLGKL